jgi:hypothetical protein
LLQAEAARHMGVSVQHMPVRMMLANDELRTVLVSIHVSLRQALEAITFERVLQTLRITDAALTPVLGRRPCMAVAGVNPHAGEGGLFGREEIDILQPSVAQAQQEGLDARGPYAPDTVFMRARKQPDGRQEFDVVIAMYHDQGLIPVKYLGVEQGVNVTLGLPLVRTSPDHGTAMDVAGLGQCQQPDSGHWHGPAHGQWCVLTPPHALALVAQTVADFAQQQHVFRGDGCSRRGFRRSLGGVQSIDLTDHHKDDEGQDDEVQRHRDEVAVSEHSAELFGFKQWQARGLTGQGHVVVGEIQAAKNLAHQGHDQVTDHRVDDFAEGAANDHTHCKVHDIALDHESFEFVCK